MIIHGIEITDNMDIKDIIALFNALIVSSETTATELDKNHKNYAEISTVSTENLAKYKAVLEAINTLQIEATETVEKAFIKAKSLGGKIDDKNKELYTNIKEHHQALFNAIDGQIKKLKTDTKTIMTEAMNDASIDTSDLAKVIDKKIGKLDLSKVYNFINITNSNLDKVIKQMAQFMTQVEQIDGILKGSISSLNQTAKQITSTTKNLNDAVGNIKSANKSVSMGMTLAMLFVGVIIGFITATYFKIDALSNFYFAEYEKKQAKLEADQKEITAKLDKSHFLVKELVKGGYKMEIGKFTDTKQTFISIKKGSFAEKPYISKSGNAITILR